MRSIPATYALGLLTAFTLAGTPAWAATTSASITDIRYQLIDLDLTDGVAPTLTIGSASSYIAAFYGNDENYDHQSASVFGIVHVGAGLGEGAARTTTTSLQSNASFISPVGIQQAYGFASQRVEFTLSPNTGLVFSALGSLSSDPVTARVEASLYATGVMRTVTNGVESNQSFENSFSLVDGERDYTLRGYLATASVEERGYLYFKTDTFVRAQPVPEPATYGMLLAGALVVGAAARRKARRA